MGSCVVSYERHAPLPLLRVTSDERWVVKVLDLVEGAVVNLPEKSQLNTYSISIPRLLHS